MMRDIYTAQMEGMQARFAIDPFTYDEDAAPARTVVANNAARGLVKPIGFNACTACGRELSWMEVTKGLATCVAKNLCAQRAEKKGR